MIAQVVDLLRRVRMKNNSNVYLERPDSFPKDCYDCNTGWCDEAWNIGGMIPGDCPLYSKKEKKDDRRTEKTSD